ncbi:hypothetical protein Q3G72_020206 [Acer saccharum]|nr:hypothetical protein Q3G72_020206 [Acer saccharum]
MLLKKNSPVLVFLSETKINGKWADKIRERLGFTSGFSVDSRGRGGDLLLMWNDSIDVTVLSFSVDHIDARIRMPDGFAWRFSGFYGNPCPSHRGESWNLLRRLRAVDDLPWVCGGDFNELLSVSEKRGGAAKSISDMVAFRQAIDDCELTDLGYSGPNYTWNNKREGKDNIQQRLDRFLANQQWIDSFLQVTVKHLGFFVSDHRPILLEFDSDSRIQKGAERGFLFEPFWMKEEDFSEVVKDAWTEKSPPQSVLDLKYKLSWCAAKLMGWSKERFGSLRKSINGKQREIEALYVRSQEPGVMERIKRLERELEGLLDCEEIYWRQRARSDWLVAGDRNSKFFHKRASSTNPSTRNINKATEAIKARLNSDMSQLLGEVFRADEVKRALFEMNPTKAPGPDGFQAIFFQKSWSVVGEELTNICLKVLNGTASIRDFNYTNIVLIPKIKNPSSPKDFRPISLCSVVYKTVTKVMANRLKEILPAIISPSQSAFIPGRLIFDNVLISFEILHSISRKKLGKRGLMALKLDMSKAYDRIEWDFIQAVMIKMNFPQNWIDLVRDCISTSSLSLLLNGKPVGKVIPSRGLRQGCPLSPYLFILCAEALSSLLQNSENNGRGLGVKCCRGSPLVSHLFFADDSVLFYRASKENCRTIRNLLTIYENGSGQQVNLQKSRITFSPNVPQDTRREIQGFFQIADCNTHDKYLGLPTLVGRNKRKTFNEIKERVWKKVCSWKSNMFSFGGKEVLINAVAQAIPTYVMSIFQLPVCLCKDLGALISKFWWGSKDGKRKTSWVSWDRMCLPKSCGGMGFKDLTLFNQSLLAKQAWCVLHHPNSLVAKVLKAKYFRQEDFLQAPLRPGCSQCWRSIIWGRELLQMGLRWKIGNGSSIKIFSDPWIPRPSSFRPISPQRCPDWNVANLMDRNNHCWDLAKLNQWL